MEEGRMLMEWEQLLRILTFIAPLSPGLSDGLRNAISLEHYPKKYRLLKEGAISRHLYFICSGSARAYFFDRHGHENTSWFLKISIPGNAVQTGDLIVPRF